MQRIDHPFPPLYDEKSKYLILGSFPSVKSREQMFFYGHPQNRFWKVAYRVFEGKTTSIESDGKLSESSCEVPKTIEEKKAFLHKNHIALWDVIASCDIQGSSDASIKNVVANDLTPILENAPIEKIFVNGKTAEKHYIKYIEPQIHRSAICLPSTSPANAAWSVDRLVKEWERLIMNSGGD